MIKKFVYHRVLSLHRYVLLYGNNFPRTNLLWNNIHFAKTLQQWKLRFCIIFLEVYKGILHAVDHPCKGEFLNCMEKQLGISAKVVSSYNTFLISTSVEQWQTPDKGTERFGNTSMLFEIKAFEG